MLIKPASLMKLTRRQLVVGGAAGAVGAAGHLRARRPARGLDAERGRAGAALPEQHLLDGIRVVQSDKVEVLVPPLHHEVADGALAVGASDLRDAQRPSRQCSPGSSATTRPHLPGSASRLRGARRTSSGSSPAAARRCCRTTGAPASRCCSTRAVPERPVGHAARAEPRRDPAALGRAGAHRRRRAAHPRDEALHDHVIRRGFAGGGFDGGTLAAEAAGAGAAQIPGADLIPDTSELFLGFTSTQKAGMGPGSIANFETLGYVDLRGSDYFRHGTHMHLSHIHEDVEAWYLNFDFDERVATAFRPNLDVRQGTQTVRQGPQGRLDRARRPSRLPQLGKDRPQRPIQTTSRLQSDHVGFEIDAPQNPGLACLGLVAAFDIVQLNHYSFLKVVIGSTWVA